MVFDKPEFSIYQIFCVRWEYPALKGTILFSWVHLQIYYDVFPRKPEIIRNIFHILLKRAGRIVLLWENKWKT